MNGTSDNPFMILKRCMIRDTEICGSLDSGSFYVMENNEMVVVE
jgi:hypothetical protein